MRAIVGSAVLVASLGCASAAERVDVAERLQRWLDGSRTLVGRFVQSLESGAFGGQAEEYGRLWVERPGLLRWDYEFPESKTAIVVEDRTLLYLASEHQMFEGRLDADARLLTALLGGTERLDRLFEVSVVADGRRVRLRPRARDTAMFEEAMVSVRRSDGALLGAEVLDSAGNRMTYRFEDLERNRPIPKGTFEFVPPPGTEIVRQP